MRPRTCKSYQRFRRGAVAVELAIWLPFLCLMFVVALDFCRAYCITQTIQAAANAGAMYASGASSSTAENSSNQAAIEAAVAEGVSLNPRLSASNVSITQTGNQTQVTVTYQYSMFLSFPGSASTVSISRSVSMTMVPQAGS